MDAAHDGLVRGGTLRPPLKRLWTRHIAPIGYALIAGGRVFTLGAAEDHAILYALDARTGRTLWRVDLDGWAVTGPAYDRGRVFTVTELGVIEAFSAKTGVSVWREGLTGNPGVDTPPTAAHGRLYIGDDQKGGRLLAFNDANGVPLWGRRVYGGDDSAAAVHGGRVFASYIGPQVYAFDARRGKLDWHFSGCCEGGGAWTPAVYRGRVYARDPQYGNRILEEATGRQRGRFAADSPPAFWRSTGLFHVGGRLVARRVGSRRRRWTFRGDGHLSTAPIVVHGIAYIGSGSYQGSIAHLYAVNVRSGRRVSSLRFKVSVWGDDERAGAVNGLSSGDGILVAQLADGRIAAFRGRRAPRGPAH